MAEGSESSELTPDNFISLLRSFHLSDADFRLLFPNAKLNKPRSIASVDAVNLAFRKVTLDLEYLRSVCLAPPEGVDPRAWVCIIGGCCSYSKRSVGTVDLDFACQLVHNRGFSTKYQEDPDLVASFHSIIVPEFSRKGSNEVYVKKLSRKSIKSGKSDFAFSDTFTEFLCLLPIDGDNLLTLAEAFPNLKNLHVTDSYFACMSHFHQLVDVGDNPRKAIGTMDRARMVFDPQARGSLNIPASAQGYDARTALTAYHSRIDCILNQRTVSTM